MDVFVSSHNTASAMRKHLASVATSGLGAAASAHSPGADALQPSATRTACAQVTGITADAQSVEQGNIYVCETKADYNGHELAPLAVQRGAALVIARLAMQGVDHAGLISSVPHKQGGKQGEGGNGAEGGEKEGQVEPAGLEAVAAAERHGSSAAGAREPGAERSAATEGEEDAFSDPVDKDPVIAEV
jgi:hypothetical protein